MPPDAEYFRQKEEVFFILKIDRFFLGFVRIIKEFKYLFEHEIKKNKIINLIGLYIISQFSLIFASNHILFKR